MGQFSKYHCLGNDFVIVENPNLDEEMVVKLCNRRTGIGADGLINLIDDKMLYYNKDGTRAKMCGNGVRTLIHYKDIETNKKLKIENVTLERLENDPLIVRANLNHPDFSTDDISPKLEGVFPINIPLIVEGHLIYTSVLKMSGVPHGVVIVDENCDLDYESIASSIKNHPIFTQEINVNFVQILSRKVIKVTTFERGVGFTPSCGTGCASSVVIASKLGLVDEIVEVCLDYGVMIVEIKEEGFHITSEVEYVYRGFYEE